MNKWNEIINLCIEQIEKDEETASQKAKEIETNSAYFVINESTYEMIVTILKTIKRRTANETLSRLVDDILYLLQNTKE